MSIGILRQPTTETPAESKRESKRLPTVLVVGPIPPPYHGTAVYTQTLLEDSSISRRFRLIHLDISDRRTISNVGTFDLGNVLRALGHAALLLVKQLRHRPDIVYLPLAENLPAVLRDCLLMAIVLISGSKLVIHRHGGRFREVHRRFPLLARLLIRVLLARAAAVIVLGETLRPIFDGLVDPDRIVVIPNGIDVTPFASIVRSPPQEIASHRPFNITYLGNLMVGKGFWYVLRAMPMLIAARPDIHLRLAGEFYDPSQERAFHEYVERQGLQDHVRYVGVVAGEAKTSLLATSDVFVFAPYESEGQPLVILEAMVAGLPVITTDRGAIKETVLNGTTGFIVPARDSAAIARKVFLLAADCSLRQRMGAAGRDRALHHFTLAAWAGAISKVFEQVRCGDGVSTSRM